MATGIALGVPLLLLIWLEGWSGLLATMARDDILVVDICLPTPLHRPMAEAARGVSSAQDWRQHV